jgi:hypothetical protein
MNLVGIRSGQWGPGIDLSTSGSLGRTRDSGTISLVHLGNLPEVLPPEPDIVVHIVPVRGSWDISDAEIVLRV